MAHVVGRSLQMHAIRQRVDDGNSSSNDMCHEVQTVMSSEPPALDRCFEHDRGHCCGAIHKVETNLIQHVWRLISNTIVFSSESIIVASTRTTHCMRCVQIVFCVCF